MKIYFEDGPLLDTRQLNIRGFIIKIDAAKGPAKNKEELDMAEEYHPNMIIYTNSLIALDNRYAWNEELEVPEIYIRSGEHMCFARIDTLTERELRYDHNICKMYLAGSFDTTTPMAESIYGESKTKRVLDNLSKDLETK